MKTEDGGVVIDGIFYENPEIAYKRYKDESIEVDTNGSETVEYYKGKSLLITGGTGFMGKATVEKLLRVCPDIDSIYMLVRERKGKNMHERLDKIFEDPLFDYLNKKNPKFRHKITPISGDVSLPDLGISDEDRKLLTSKVQIIIHAAASVNLDSKLKFILEVNFFGTRKVVNLAKQCCNLESFVVVSTAFAPCETDVIEEKFYKTHISPDNLLALIEGKSDDEIEELVPSLLINTYPNTYQFTKALIESYLEENCQDLPLMIFRPAMITTTYKEPLRGWTDNIYGPIGATAGAGVGLIHTMPINENNLADMVPVDYCVNAMLVGAAKKSQEVRIYNYTSSCENPIDWKTYMKYMQNYGEQIPPKSGIWIYFLSLQSNFYMFYLEALLYHLIPGALADLALLLSGNKPKLIKAYKKIHRALVMFGMVTSINWKWKNDNTQALWRSISEADRRVFPFSMQTVDWPAYCQMGILGMRTYLIKEDLSTLPEGRRKNRIFRMLHKAIRYTVIFLALRLVYNVFWLIVF